MLVLDEFLFDFVMNMFACDMRKIVEHIFKEFYMFV